MRAVWIAIASVLVAGTASADDAERKTLAPNSIYVEGLGAALLYSLNYERVFADRIGLRLGLSYFPEFTWTEEDGRVTRTERGLVVPLMVDYLGLRKGRNVLELGAGASVAFGFESGTDVAGTALVGYRFHPLDHGFQFRIGLMLVVFQGAGVNENRIGALPWTYLSFGYAFGRK